MFALGKDAVGTPLFSPGRFLRPNARHRVKGTLANILCVEDNRDAARAFGTSGFSAFAIRRAHKKNADVVGEHARDYIGGF